MTTKKKNVGTKKENANLSVEIHNLIQRARYAYRNILINEAEKDKNIYHLGQKLFEIKGQCNTSKLIFKNIIKEKFAFSRQYAYRMIAFYNIQKELREKNLVYLDSFLSNSMLMILNRAKDPVMVWIKASEKGDTKQPSEALVRQAIREMNAPAQMDVSKLSTNIANANSTTIVSVLQKIRKQNYPPTPSEQERLIMLLKESWEHNTSDKDNKLEESEREDEVA